LKLVHSSYLCFLDLINVDIKPQRIRWLGHVKRMEERAMARKMMEGRLFVGRRKGRLRLRWMDDVVADLRAMRIKQWIETMQDRNGGGLLRRPRFTQGCSAKRKAGRNEDIKSAG